MAKIPIHLLIKNLGSLVENEKEFIASLDMQNITYVWYLINAEDDFRKARLINRSTSALPVWFFNNSSLIPEIIKEDDLDIAFPLRLLKDLNSFKVYKNIFLKYKPRIYIVDDNLIKFNSNSAKIIKLIDESTKRFKEWGIKEIQLSFEPDNIVKSIEFQRNIKEKLGIPLLIPFTSFDNRGETVLKNSLLLGNLFYEKSGESILIKYENVEKFLWYVKEDINLIKTILGSLGLVKIGYTIISCPKCGRCQMDLLKINREVDDYLGKLEKEYNQRGILLEDIGGITVAVMGCNVNGPGEARGADIGIAGGKNGRGTIFKYGIPFETLPEDQVVGKFLQHVKTLIDKKVEDSGIKVS